MSQHVCPTCGDEFDTEGGRNKHHAFSHGESIAKETSTCEFCGEKFSYYPSDKSGVACSDCVGSGEEYRNTEGLSHRGLSGSDNPNWSGGRRVTCDWCGDEVYKSPDDIQRADHNFCEKECMNLFLSDKYQKCGNPYWRGGYDPEYGYGWWEAREKALERDNHRCQSCGKEKEDIGHNPDVHHIKPVRGFDEKEDAHSLDNLICLCRQCHSDVEGITERFKLLERIR